MKKLHIFAKAIYFSSQNKKCFSDNIFSIGVHWGGLGSVYIYAEWVYWILNNFIKQNPKKFKTKYFGEIGGEPLVLLLEPRKPLTSAILLEVIS
jgi:hypothetical protein